MCHVTRHVTLATPASVEATPVIGSIRGSKLNSSQRISPFRKIAKSARVNLNKYWGIISHRQQTQSNKSEKKNSSSAAVTSAFEFDHSAEMEENHLNEMLEALANAEEQNSINSLIESESEYSPEQPRRMFVRQGALSTSSYSSINSFSSSCGSHHHYF